MLITVRQLEILIDTTHCLCPEILEHIQGHALEPGGYLIDPSYFTNTSLKKGYIFHPDLMQSSTLEVLEHKNTTKYYTRVYKRTHSGRERWNTLVDQANHWAVTALTSRHQEVYAKDQHISDALGDTTENTWPNRRFLGEHNILNYNIFHTVKLVTKEEFYATCIRHLLDSSKHTMYSIKNTKDTTLTLALLIIDKNKAILDMNMRPLPMSAVITIYENTGSLPIQPEHLIRLLAYLVNHNISVRLLNSRRTLYHIRMSGDRYEFEYTAEQVPALSILIRRYKEFLLLINKKSECREENKKILNKAKRHTPQIIQNTSQQSRIPLWQNVHMIHSLRERRYCNVTERIRAIDIRKKSPHPSTYIRHNKGVETYEIQSEKQYLDNILDIVSHTKDRHYPPHTYITWPSKWDLAVNKHRYLGLPCGSRSNEDIISISLGTSLDLSIIFEDGHRLGHNCVNNTYDGWEYNSNILLDIPGAKHTLGFIICASDYLAQPYKKSEEGAHLVIYAPSGVLINKKIKLRSRTECIGLYYDNSYWIWNGLYINNKTTKGGTRYYNAIFDQCVPTRISLKDLCLSAGYETYDPNNRGKYIVKDIPYPAAPNIDLEDYPHVIRQLHNLEKFLCQ